MTSSVNMTIVPGTACSNPVGIRRRRPAWPTSIVSVRGARATASIAAADGLVAVVSATATTTSARTP